MKAKDYIVVKDGKQYGPIHADRFEYSGIGNILFSIHGAIVAEFKEYAWDAFYVDHTFM